MWREINDFSWYIIKSVLQVSIWKPLILTFQHLSWSRVWVSLLREMHLCNTLVYDVLQTMCLSVYLITYLWMYFCLLIYLSPYLSLNLSVCLSACASPWLSTFCFFIYIFSESLSQCLLSLSLTNYLFVSLIDILRFCLLVSF